MGMKLKEKQLEAATPLVQAIERCSLPRATWHLDAFERWVIVRDTLLGHAPYRGGLRPRDLPIDQDCRKMLGGIAQFHNRGPERGDDKTSIDYHFGDWLYAFAVLVQPLLHEEGGPDAPPVAHQAVYQCFREIRNALPRRVTLENARGSKEEEYENPNSGEFAKTCPVLHRLIGAVGWSIKDWNYLHTNCPKVDPGSASKKRVVANCAEIARLAARVAIGHANLERLPRTHQPWLTELQKPDLRIITAMTKSVQDYICRGRRHWLMRGASAFSAQSLAFVRDTISEQQETSLLLSDSDVVVSFLVPADTTLDACQVMDAMWTTWRDRKAFLRRFPRLAEVPELNHLDSLDPTSVFPTISIRMSKRMSLLDLCSPRQPQRDDDKPDFESEAIRGGRPSAGIPSARPCTYVAGDIAITDRPPAWLEERGDNDGMSKHEKDEEAFGFTALVWSLCGTTLKAHWFQNASKYEGELTNETTGRLVPGLRMMPVHHSEWLKWLHADTEALVFLKLDGDGVGSAFTSVPIPRRPYLSMELSRLVLERVRNATWSVIEQRVALTDALAREMDQLERAELLRENVPVEGGTIPLPADMVYVGGDDIFFCLPESSVAPFLAGFSGPVSNDYPDAWKKLRFKFVSVTLPRPVKNHREMVITEEPQFDPESREMRLHPKSRRMQDANLWASQLAGDALKKVAKAEDAALQLRILDEIKARWTETYGFDCELWDPPLNANPGTIDDRVVHGIHVRLIPKQA